MDKNTITALAREYAEEIVQDTDSYPELPISLLNEMRKEVAEDFEEKIRFLLRRFCLVEKEAVRKVYKEAQYNFDNASDPVMQTMEFHNGIMSAIESLFPEIGKEAQL